MTEMKFKRLVIALLVCALCTLMVCAFGWYRAERDQSDLEQVCYYAAANANERFCSYQQRGSEYDYHYAVSELTAFYDAYAVLTAGSDSVPDSNRLYLNQLLGHLMDYPELDGEVVQLLAELTAKLKVDIHDANAYDDIFCVYNHLAR